MRVHLFPFSEQPVSNWSGGSTRQLAIYPFNANLADRDFIFRISTATVETETSSFSKFDGFQRVLMILQGELKIVHKDHHTKKLGPFDTDTFDGSWDTSAEGKVSDFNVIYSDKVKRVDVKKLNLTVAEQKIIELDDFSAIYLLTGSMKINDQEVDEKGFILIEKGLLTDTAMLVANEDCIYILVSINIP